MATAPVTRLRRSGTQWLLPVATRRAHLLALQQQLDALLLCRQPTADEIHRLRVCIKKLRAWLRLLRCVGGHGHGRLLDSELRAIAGACSPQRDREAMQHTLLLLQRECTNAGQRRLLAGLRSFLLAQTPAATALPELTAAVRDKLRHICGIQPGRAELWQGLQRSYRRTRCRRKRACAYEADAAVRHRWRKRVKYLCYQLQSVAARIDDHPPLLQKRLARLGTVLGELQDIEVLQQQLARLPPATHAAARKLAAELLERAGRQRLCVTQNLCRQCFSHKELSEALVDR